MACNRADIAHLKYLYFRNGDIWIGISGAIPFPRPQLFGGLTVERRCQLGGSGAEAVQAIHDRLAAVPEKWLEAPEITQDAATVGFVSRYVYYSSLRANFPIRSSDACAPLLPSFIACHGAQPERGYNTVLFFSFSCRSDWLYVMLYGEFS